jgi:hypothetical protein
MQFSEPCARPAETVTVDAQSSPIVVRRLVPALCQRRVRLVQTMDFETSRGGKARAQR